MVATTETKSETLSVKITPETLSALQDAAASDGRRVEDVAEDAMAAYVEERRNGGGRVRNWNSNPNVRPEMMAHFEASIAAHRRLGELLAQ